MKTGIPPLSKRMSALVSLVSPCETAADIGCDHGYVSIALSAKGICKRCTASDVRSRPAAAARKNAEKYGVSNRVEVCIGNGLETVESADCIIISGMGAETILSILKEGSEKVRLAKELLLGPQSEAGKVRAYLCEHDLLIADERLVKEGGKYYPLIKAVPVNKAEELSEEEVLFGPVLIRKKDEVLKEYLEKRKNVLSRILSDIRRLGKENAFLREKELRHEYGLIEKVLKTYVS